MSAAKYKECYRLSLMVSLEIFPGQFVASGYDDVTLKSKRWFTQAENWAPGVGIRFCNYLGESITSMDQTHSKITNWSDFYLWEKSDFETKTRPNRYQYWRYGSKKRWEK